MSGKLKRHAQVLIEHDDMALLMTELLCGWGLFDGLHVVFVSEKAGSFQLNLAPRPAAAKK